jgi:hypothetical protein
VARRASLMQAHMATCPPLPCMLAKRLYALLGDGRRVRVQILSLKDY